MVWQMRWNSCYLNGQVMSLVSGCDVFAISFIPSPLFLSPASSIFLCLPAICFIYFFASLCWCLSYFFPSQPYISLITCQCLCHFIATQGYISFLPRAIFHCLHRVMFLLFHCYPGLYFIACLGWCLCHFISCLGQYFYHFIPTQGYISLLA